MFWCGGALAGDTKVGVDTDAAALSTSSVTVESGKQAPVVGFPGLAQSSPPSLFSVNSPSYVLFGRLLDLTAQFGDTVITGKDDVAQITTDGGDIATVTFAPSPHFVKYRGNGANHDARTLSARFTSRFKGNVEWLGSVIVTSKKGATMVPPQEKGFVWEAIKSASLPNLRDVIVVPVPQGYGVTVGVSHEGSGIGIASSLAKLATLFIGIGPSYTNQSGTTLPTGSWSMQFIVLREVSEGDPSGIPFSIDLLTIPDQKGAGTERPNTTADQVTQARETAVRQARELASALEKIRQEKDAISAGSNNR